ncbi:N-formylglutamate amidohydrolase [Labrenzia sp. PHM005]|uniref:N-formylglutamate amidohydrolase n=1 Tax=Labrenzia sp. PHM005 TaxID=2590016 RepID=UPI001AD90E03|nr:N-formylglutamate amidohydrolase [Labrenzia sp. PHM005]
MGSSHQNGGMTRAVEVLNAEGAGELVLLCDHASNHFPPPYDQCLGVSEDDKSAHISWDPGALGVAKALSEALDSPLVYTTVSRLVIDCNREEDREDLTPSLSELTEISGNRDLSEEERAFRLDLVHRPFHNAIDKLLSLRKERGLPSAVVSVHTYTPVYKGKQRPWEIGLISESDRSLANPVLDGLNARGDLTVGDNEPYAPSDGVYYTVRRHGEDRSLPCLMIEIRNDEVTTPDEERRWADLLGPLLKSAAQGALQTSGEEHA